MPLSLLLLREEVLITHTSPQRNICSSTVELLGYNGSEIINKYRKFHEIKPCMAQLRMILTFNIFFFLAPSVQGR